MCSTNDPLYSSFLPSLNHASNVFIPGCSFLTASISAVYPFALNISIICLKSYGRRLITADGRCARQTLLFSTRA